MAQVPQIAWGEWLRERARFIGFVRLGTFADAIGCTRNQLSRWLGASAAPSRVCKGFDVAMARALKTDARTLFVEFASVEPSVAPILGDVETPEVLREQIESAIESMNEPSLRVIRATTLALCEMGAHAA